jgi:hypothetical protein
MTSTSIAIFVLMAVPGIVLELLRRTARPGREESAFVETGRVLVGGVLLSTAALVCLGAVRSAVGSPISDPRLLLTQQNYVPDHLWMVVFDVALFIGVSSTLAALFFTLLPFGGLSGRIAPESAWVTVFARLVDRLHAEQPDALRGKKIITQLQVDLTDGTGYVGVRESYSADLAPEGRELVLAKPLFRVSSEGAIIELDESWQRVVLTNDKINSIRVKFSVADDESGNPAHRVVKASAGTVFQRTVHKVGGSPLGLLALLVAQLLAPLLIGWFT